MHSSQSVVRKPNNSQQRYSKVHKELPNTSAPPLLLFSFRSPLCTPKAFSLMAGALERSGSTPTGTLRMELMQGLVKMAWGSSNRGDSTPRGAPASSGAFGAQPPAGDRFAGTKTLGSATAAASRTRIESIDSSRWSEADFGSESADGDFGLPSPRDGAPPASISRGKSGGARDIFNMPYTEQVGGWVGGVV